MEFIRKHPTDFCYAHKILSLSLLGRRVCQELRSKLVVQLHDDLVERARVERKLVADLRRDYPSLRDFPSLRHQARLYRLSRFSEAAARRQELSWLSLCRTVMIDSVEEIGQYRAVLPATTRVERIPGAVELETPRRRDDLIPTHDAGFIASGASCNIAACLYLKEEILPAIRRLKPDFSLLIVGSVSAAARRLGDWGPGVDIVDRIEDLAEFYGRIRVALVPLRQGTGVSLKTLEAFGYGRPVVSTAIGARGIPDGFSAALHIVDGAEAFAARVIEVINSDPKPTPPVTAAEVAARRQVFLDRFAEIIA